MSSEAKWKRTRGDLSQKNSLLFGPFLKAEKKGIVIEHLPRALMLTGNMVQYHKPYHDGVIRGIYLPPFLKVVNGLLVISLLHPGICQVIVEKYVPWIQF